MTHSFDFDPYDFILRQRDGELRSIDMRRLEVWLRRSASNQRQMRSLQLLLNARTSWAMVDLSRARMTIRDGIREDIIEKNPISRASDFIYREQGGRRRSLGYRVTALVLPLLFVGICTLLWQGNNTVRSHSPETVPVFATGIGERAAIDLVDGTRVILGPSTRLRVDKSYNREGRSVLVEGEAYFQIAHRAASPFIVLTKGLRTRVLGTSFAVRAYEADERDRVVVRDGRVAVQSIAEKDKTQELTLVRNELVEMDRGSGMLNKRNVDATRYIEWVQGRLEYVEAPVSTVVADLRRTFAIELRIESSNLSEQPITGVFDNSLTPRGAANLLATMLGGTVEVRGTMLYITER